MLNPLQSTKRDVEVNDKRENMYVGDGLYYLRVLARNEDGLQKRDGATEQAEQLYVGSGDLYGKVLLIKKDEGAVEKRENLYVGDGLYTLSALAVKKTESE
jgi:hypothetical protein